MAKFIISEVPATSKVEILRHVFNGLADIKNAVETYCRIGDTPWGTEPKAPVTGLHLICIYLTVLRFIRLRRRKP